LPSVIKVQSTIENMNEEILIYCPECRGKISFDLNDIIEDDIIDCDICGAEMLIEQADPLKIRLVEEADF
jgi:DNA-directed RNA polymerase subunit RPC12/RpoP